MFFLLTTNDVYQVVTTISLWFMRGAYIYGKKGKKKKKSLKGGGKLNGIWRKFCSHREIHKFKYINFSRQGRKRRSRYENFQPDCTLSQSISLFAAVSESFALRWQEINFFTKFWCITSRTGFRMLQPAIFRFLDNQQQRATHKQRNCDLLFNFEKIINFSLHKDRLSGALKPHKLN